jgi:hypothetical protein
MNNFIALTTNDIIIYNHIQSKIYNYFISYHKENTFTIDDNSNEINDNNYKKYCKFFKFNVCLCYRNKININNYPDIYKCPNNKKILYNLNNFNFLNPISITTNNNKIYPIDIFTYYRQEYLPFIINDEFNKYKNNQMKLKIINKRKLLKSFNLLKSYSNHLHSLKYNFKVFKEITKKSLNKNSYIKEKSFNLLKYYSNHLHFLKYNFKVFNEITKKSLNKNSYYNDYLKEKSFNILKCYSNHYHSLKYNFKVFKEITKKSLNKKIHISYNNNSYYNDLIDVFINNPLNTSKTISTQTEEPAINYSLLFAIILNDYTNLIGDYNDLIISLIKY